MPFSLSLRSFLFSRSIRQTLRETLLIGGGIWLILLLIQICLHPAASDWLQWEQSSYINIACLSWLILRIAPPQHLWSKDLLKQIFASFTALVLLHIPYVISMYLLFSANVSAKNAPDFYSMLQIEIYITLFWLLFFSGIVYVFHFWNRLRQQSLHWTLIHAHVMVLAVVVWIVLLYDSLQNRPFPSIDLQLLENFFFFLFLFFVVTFVLLLVLSPPLILFAYFVTHPTIKRINALVTVTNELRSGKYTVRAPVEGKDEIAQLQQNFNVMADELEKTIRDLQTERDHVAFLLNERRELFANVSHELRTPIATLRGYLESDLRNRTQIPESRLWEDIAVMEREVLQLQERADELFALSKAEIEQTALQRTPCDVHQLVRTLVSSYAPLAWRTGKVEMVADIPDEVPLVSADEPRLEQALKNIVRNALRHTPPGGVIALIITIEPERVGISVEDTGEGIAPEELEHIWERFYQAKTAQQPGGAGIGLSLVKEWITGMGGSVAATSTLGDGSCFTLYLPRLR